jgi:heat shock protein HslJ
MARFGVAVLCVWALSSGVATAGERPLICFGNEPSWRVDLTEPGTATYSTPDSSPASFRGSAARNEPLREAVWRGSPAAGRDLVVFLKDDACSDGMSDDTHPVIARVSTPDGRFLAGCCRIPAGAAAAGAAGARPLEGVSWKLTGLPGKDPKVVAAAPRPATIRFEGGRISGFSGCNNLMGGYTLDGNKIKLQPLAGTMMMCPPAAMALEDAFKAALSGTLGYAIAGDALSLTTESGAVLTFAAEPPPRLEGVAWEVTSFNNNRDAVVGLMTGTRITMSFAEGTVSGNAGCNTYRASYKADGGSIKVGPAVTTRKACATEVMTQEQLFLKALESTVTWAIERGVLDMHRADKQRTIWASPGK